MSRYEQHEQWDIVSGVGITALAVAAARSVESHRPNGLINDPYAESFVTAAEPPMPMPTRPDSGVEPEDLWERMAEHMGVRSRFFDDFFRASGERGVRQVVILAAGLDTRAYRLAWPSGTRVFELDQPRVLEFKNAVLRGRDAEPTCDRRPVPVDLREDWATPLREAGFDPAVPTAWLAEGLMPYLPGPAQRDLMTTIASLSAPGSRVAVEYMNDIGKVIDDPELSDLSRRFGFDMPSLIPQTARDNDVSPQQWLPAGWTADSDTAEAVAGRYGRRFAGFTDTMPAVDYRFLVAHAG